MTEFCGASCLIAKFTFADYFLRGISAIIESDNT